MIFTSTDIDISSPENVELLRNIFAAKEVPLALLLNVETQRSFHAADWDAVRQSVSGELKGFDFYFDFVLSLVEKLKSAGVI